MIELTNAYSYFASAIFLLGWITAGDKKGTKSLFGFGFFISFILYIGSSYLYFSEIDDFLKRLCIDLLILSAASFVLSKMKSSIFPTIGVFIIMLFGFSQYVFHSDRTNGLKLENISTGNELLLELSPDVSINELDDFKNRYQLSITKAYQPIDGNITDLDDYYLIDIPNTSQYSAEEILNQLKKLNHVDWVEYNEAIDVTPGIETGKTLRKTPSKNIYNDARTSEQWSLNVLNMADFHASLPSMITSPKKTALLVILDTGVDSKHEDIADNYKSISTSYDNDPRGHGTHCAGIAGAVTNNKIGIASIVPNNKWVNISSVTVLNKTGGGTQNTIIRGIITATDAGADVISMSLGARANMSSEKAYKKAIKYANDHGAIVVVAAGNSNLNANTFAPANTEDAITVSAIDNNKNKASFSNYFTTMKYAIAAPGVDILSTVPGDGYKANSGTSMAAPHVAGLVAMMKSIQPDLDTKEAAYILQQSGTETNDTNRTGKLINPSGAIKMLLNK